jgi:hypothetical protein
MLGQTPNLGESKAMREPGKRESIMRMVIAGEPGRLQDGLQSMVDSFFTLEWVTVVDDGVDKVLLKGFTAAELSDAISQLSNDVRG